MIVVLAVIELLSAMLSEYIEVPAVVSDLCRAHLETDKNVNYHFLGLRSTFQESNAQKKETIVLG